MTSSDPKAVVTRYVEAVRDGDAAAIRDSFAADATWEYPGDLPISRVWAGRDVIVEEFLGGVRSLLADGSPAVIELTGVLADGEQVVAEWTARATARSGAPYRNRNCAFFIVRDGKIASVREYTDTRHAAQVLFGAA